MNFFMFSPIVLFVFLSCTISGMGKNNNNQPIDAMTTPPITGAITLWLHLQSLFFWKWDGLLLVVIFNLQVTQNQQSPSCTSGMGKKQSTNQPRPISIVCHINQNDLLHHGKEHSTDACHPQVLTGNVISWDNHNNSACGCQFSHWPWSPLNPPQWLNPHVPSFAPYSAWPKRQTTINLCGKAATTFFHMDSIKQAPTKQRCKKEQI